MNQELHKSWSYQGPKSCFIVRGSGLRQELNCYFLLTLPCFALVFSLSRPFWAFQQASRLPQSLEVIMQVADTDNCLLSLHCVCVCHCDLRPQSEQRRAVSLVCHIRENKLSFHLPSTFLPLITPLLLYLMENSIWTIEYVIM